MRGCCSTAALQNATVPSSTCHPAGAHQACRCRIDRKQDSVALTRDVRKVTHCRLVWRKDTIIGVEFVGRT
jgi:hypothetical protein